MRSLFPALCASSLLMLAACGNEPEPAPAENITPPATEGPGTPEPAPDPAPVPMPSPSAETISCGPVSTTGYCGITAGLGIEDAKSIFPGELIDPGTQADESGTCTYLQAELPEGTVYFMFVDGVFNRVDVRMPGISTDGGAEVGMMKDSVIRLYPGLEQRPNKYVPDQPDLVVTEDGGKIIFETDESGYVSSYHAGISPGVDYVEGCA